MANKNNESAEDSGPIKEPPPTSNNGRLPGMDAPPTLVKYRIQRKTKYERKRLNEEGKETGTGDGVENDSTVVDTDKGWIAALTEALPKLNAKMAHGEIDIPDAEVPQLTFVIKKLPAKSQERDVE